MNWLIVILAILVLGLYFYPAQTKGSIEGVYTFAKDKVQGSNITSNIVNNVVGNPEETTTTTIPINYLGKPQNFGGVFDCGYDSDCKIYFDCTSCYCEEETGQCYTLI